MLKRNDRANSARRVDSSRLAHIVTSDVAGSFSVTMVTRSVLSGGLAWRALFADQRKDHDRSFGRHVVWKVARGGTCDRTDQNVVGSNPGGATTDTDIR